MTTKRKTKNIKLMYNLQQILIFYFIVLTIGLLALWFSPGPSPLLFVSFVVCKGVIFSIETLLTDMNAAMKMRACVPVLISVLLTIIVIGLI